jgi:ATP-binding protein involved in chromosome partitioning
MQVAKELSTQTGKDVSLLAQIPISSKLSASSDEGQPLVLSHPDEPAAQVITELGQKLSQIKLGKESLTLNVKLST